MSSLQSQTTYGLHSVYMYIQIVYCIVKQSSGVEIFCMCMNCMVFLKTDLALELHIW